MVSYKALNTTIKFKYLPLLWFNRTFMELKFVKEHYDMNNVYMV